MRQLRIFGPSSPAVRVDDVLPSIQTKKGLNYLQVTIDSGVSPMEDKRQRREVDHRPANRWWQWFLLYPSLGVAIVSATPVLADKALAVYHSTDTATYSEAIKQRDMWAKNLQCSASPFSWYSNPSNVKVDATMCPSGDLFVRAITPDNRSFYHWVPLDEVVRSRDEGGLVPAAKAAPFTPRTISDLGPSRSSAGAYRLAMQIAQVICQRPLDQRIMVRRIQTPQGCFDEFVDMFNGAVVGRRPAPCVPQC
jgi:hypothetical protein